MKACILMAIAMMNVIVCGCGPIVVIADPCGENDGRFEGDLLLEDDIYFDDEGVAFARLGDGNVGRCTIVNGSILLRGKVSHLNDFDNVEAVANIYVEGAELPSERFEIGDTEQTCGVLGPFPSLIRVEGAVESGGTQQGCLQKSGFEKLEYVGKSFRCGLNREVGKSLRHVGGTLVCDGANLGGLEYAGELFSVVNLPSLRFVGRLEINQIVGVTQIELPSLEQVGPIPHSDSVFQGAGLFIWGNQTVYDVDLPSLEHVEGEIRIVSNRGTFPDGSQYDSLTQKLRAQLAETTNTASRRICGNGDTARVLDEDPCPQNVDECIDFYGEQSVYCCDLPTWDACVTAYGDF